ncbi:glutathione S-transferase N-terminal domain-containing protein [Patulibacter sp.]|uniref:glutathione S-transferase N-terminal domain-containing protein n=1 Tax=Patulibacter sp. TaxID=1912859 RepID=UPI0027214D6D|nr:glutathione S-transferase N-terminal domain-containing protein [Patulibacter sp.]MDO9407334.1 glutathione S-transferase N-terminal domain-containing protein [Patulibacter sp.]
MAKVKLHRCNYTFLHTNLDACWVVQKELDAQGIDYEIVKQGWGKGKRPKVEAISGQSKLPVLELADGEVYRAESKEMAARVRSGQLPTG